MLPKTRGFRNHAPFPFPGKTLRPSLCATKSAESQQPRNAHRLLAIRNRKIQIVEAHVDRVQHGIRKRLWSDWARR